MVSPRTVVYVVEAMGQPEEAHSQLLGLNSEGQTGNKNLYPLSHMACPLLINFDNSIS